MSDKKLAVIFPGDDTVAFIGEADPWSDVNAVKKKAEDLGIRLYTYPDCNHSLECDDVDRNLKNLREVMRITKEYIAKGSC